MRDEAHSCVSQRGRSQDSPAALIGHRGFEWQEDTGLCVTATVSYATHNREREEHTHTHTHRKASVINDNIFNRDTDRNTINQFPVSKRGTFSTIRASVFIKITWKEKWCIISHTHTHTHTQWDGNIWNPLKRVGPCEENKTINHTEWVFWKCKNAESCVCVCVCVLTQWNDSCFKWGVTLTPKIGFVSFSFCLSSVCVCLLSEL